MVLTLNPELKHWIINGGEIFPPDLKSIELTFDIKSDVLGQSKDTIDIPLRQIDRSGGDFDYSLGFKNALE